MAEVRVNLDDADGRLPDVCMCCGEEATTTTTKNMSWCPPWVGVLVLVAVPVYLVVMLIMTKRAKVQVPLCEDHKGHWFNRHLIVWGSFALVALLGLAIFIMMMALPREHTDRIGPFACIGGLVLFIAWLVVLIVCQSTAIRPKEITDDDITLQGVSEAFVDAVEDAYRERRARRKKKRLERHDDDEEEDVAPRPRKKSSSDGVVDKKRRRDADEEEDEPPPRKKRRPIDDDED